MGPRFLYKDLLPFIAMVSVECTNVGVNTLFKAASSKGMSYYVFIVYSHAISTLVLLPVPFIFYRAAAEIKLASSLIEFLFLAPYWNYFHGGDERMEKVAMRRSSSQAKIVGTMVSIGGALVVLFYKGPTILSTISPTNTTSFRWPLASAMSDWIIGGLLLATQYLLCSLWYIIQAEILKIYPEELIVTFVYTSCVTLLSAPVCFVAESNLDAWLLKPHLALLAILCSGIFVQSYSIVIHSWGLRLKGPLYVAIFKPLSIAIAAFMGVVFLGDALHLGMYVCSSFFIFVFHLYIPLDYQFHKRKILQEILLNLHFIPI
ncbi:WAT1-related protein At5g40240-like [Jatropha curcas]|uniref:WAT1-related protein At5g40240-like n=1 Tax=Jatropha curcas TaxID=180498 RepID=UPI001893097F|nr:WAT1-related protein At5g40240-like [Jatropha curcas]